MPLPILPQLPGPSQIVRSVKDPGLFYQKDSLSRRLLRLGTGRTPGLPSPTPTFPFSKTSLLNDSDHRQPGYRPDIWSLLTVHVSTMRFSNRVPELVLVQRPIPSPKKRGHCHAGRVWIRPRSPQNNSSFVHTLGITKL